MKGVGGRGGEGRTDLVVRQRERVRETGREREGEGEGEGGREREREREVERERERCTDLVVRQVCDQIVFPVEIRRHRHRRLFQVRGGG